MTLPPLCPSSQISSQFHSIIQIEFVYKYSFTLQANVYKFSQLLVRLIFGYFMCTNALYIIRELDHKGRRIEFQYNEQDDRH